jgi:hypothetical protein
MISKLINNLLIIQNIIFFLKLSNIKFWVSNLCLILNDIKYNLDFDLNLSINFLKHLNLKFSSKVFIKKKKKKKKKLFNEQKFLSHFNLISVRFLFLKSEVVLIIYKNLHF